MVVFESLQALQGDCLVLRLPAVNGGARTWLIDGGPGSGSRDGWKGAPKVPKVVPWRDVLLPVLGHHDGDPPAPLDLTVCSHIDDDHIEGLRLLVRKAAESILGTQAPVAFERFWFNSLSAILEGNGGSAATSALAGEVGHALMSVGALTQASIAAAVTPPRDTPEAVIQSIGQGRDLESDLTTLGLAGNPPFHGPVCSGVRVAGGDVRIDMGAGVFVTVLGPRAVRLETLRKEWAKAVAEPDAKKRAAVVADYFLPTSELDDAYPNLSSIVLLVEAEGRRLLLTGDALGDDVVASWRDDLGHGAETCPVDILKLPHHGSIRNTTRRLLDTFPADHYVFSANGKYENPDAPTVEAVVATAGGRPITLHFTNGGVVWEKPYTLEKAGADGSRAEVADLGSLKAALEAAYGATFGWNVRTDPACSIRIDLSPKPAGP